MTGRWCTLARASLHSTHVWQRPQLSPLFNELKHVTDFVDMGENHDGHAEAVTGHFIDVLKDRIDKVKVHDHAIKTFSDSQKKKKRKRTADSDLQEFLG